MKCQFPQLEYEHNLYKVLKDGGKSSTLTECSIVEGISKVFWFGIEGDYRTLVIELLSKSLEDLF